MTKCQNGMNRLSLLCQILYTLTLSLLYAQVPDLTRMIVWFIPLGFSIADQHCYLRSCHLRTINRSDLSAVDLVYGWKVKAMFFPGVQHD